MANSDTYTVTRGWTAIEANGIDITDGTFTIVNKTKNAIELIQSDTAPDPTAVGDFFLVDVNDSIRLTLEADENFFARSPRGAVEIGVATA